MSNPESIPTGSGSGSFFERLRSSQAEHGNNLGEERVLLQQRDVRGNLLLCRIFNLTDNEDSADTREVEVIAGNRNFRRVVIDTEHEIEHKVTGEAYPLYVELREGLEDNS